MGVLSIVYIYIYTYIYIRGCRKVSGEFVKECRDEDSHRGRRAWLLMHLMTTQTVQLMSSSF